MDLFDHALQTRMKAVISEYQERGPLRAGDRVTVVGFEGVEDLYGVKAKAFSRLIILSKGDNP